MRPPDLFIGQVVFRTDIALMREARFSLRCLSEFLPLTDQPNHAGRGIPRLARPRPVTLIVELLGDLEISDDQAALTRATLAGDPLDHFTLFCSVSIRFPTGLSHRYLFSIHSLFKHSLDQESYRIGDEYPPQIVLCPARQEPFDGIGSRVFAAG